MTREESDRRLGLLADLLESLPEEQFDYGVWVGTDWKGADDLSCGTSACALGWATTIPEFKAEGLHLWRSEPGSRGLVKLDPHGISGYSAGAEVFGLSNDDSAFLFGPSTEHEDTYRDEEEAPDWESPDGDADAAQVAEHIRRFVAWRQRVRVPA